MTIKTYLGASLASGVLATAYAQGILDPVNGSLPQNPHGYDPEQVQCAQCHVVNAGSTNNVPEGDSGTPSKP